MIKLDPWVSIGQRGRIDVYLLRPSYGSINAGRRDAMNLPVLRDAYQSQSQFPNTDTYAVVVDDQTFAINLLPLGQAKVLHRIYKRCQVIEPRLAREPLDADDVLEYLRSSDSQLRIDLLKSSVKVCIRLVGTRNRKIQLSRF